MNPATALHWQDRDAMRALVAELGFGALFAATPDGVEASGRRGIAHWMRSV